MEIYQQRRDTVKDTTFSEVRFDYFNAERFCYTLEDKLREIPGEPVENWKVPGKTAIPACRVRVTLENSGKFGPDTITLNDVPGFTFIRVHGGNDDEHSHGCPIAGFEIVEDPDGDGGNIKGGTSGPAVDALKAKIKDALARGEEVWWNVLNPPGYTGPVDLAT